MTVKRLYRFPRSSETIESDSFERPGKISTFFFTFFFISLLLQLNTLATIQISRLEKYTRFSMLYFRSFLLFLSLLRAFMTLKY